MEQQCSNLEDILNYKEANNPSVILCRGNHDMQEMGYPWAQCSHWNAKVAEWMISIKDRFLDLTQWVHIEGNVLFSHAGISQVWFNTLDLGRPTAENIWKINDLPPSELFAFTPRSLSDYYGDSKTQPCTWIRPGALCESHVPHFIQVVGHTPPRKAGELIRQMPPELRSQYPNMTMPELWCVDALPDWYMVIEDGKREIRRWINKK